MLPENESVRPETGKLYGAGPETVRPKPGNRAAVLLVKGCKQYGSQMLRAVLCWGPVLIFQYGPGSTVFSTAGSFGRVCTHGEGQRIIGGGGSEPFWGGV